jgi:hypothetical protein
MGLSRYPHTGRLPLLTADIKLGEALGLPCRVMLIN